MSEEERRLNNKIHLFEDMLLREKNYCKAEQISCELMNLRKSLQKLKYKNQS